MKHRLLIRDGTIIRRLASVIVKDRDGSIILSIVRKGTNQSGWDWSRERQDYVPVAYETPRERSLRVTVHPSGQVNYHKEVRHTVFLPSLFDLSGPIPIVNIVAPGFAALDPYEGDLEGSSVCDVVNDRIAKIGFCFAVIPVSEAALPGEIWRITMWGAFGLSCFAFNPSEDTPLFNRAPVGTFTTLILERALAARAIPEDEAYIKFHQAAIRIASPSDQGRAEVEQKDVGPLIFGPRDGVWTIVCAVQMHSHPILEVQFLDARYRADTIAVEPWDRLQLVRVQFKIFDTVKSAYVKTHVEISGYSLATGF